MEKLEELIIRYNDAYRNGEPLVSDVEYDKLIDRLALEFPNSKLIDSIIEKESSSRDITIPYSSMSLDKYKTIDKLLNKFVDEEYVLISPKFDGITMNIWNDDNGNVHFATRGDGKIGRDCSQHMKHLKAEYSNLPKNMMIRGELIITNINWKNNEIFNSYTSPRNTVAGWINGDYVETTPYNLLTFKPYNIYGHDGIDKYNNDWLCDDFIRVKTSCINLEYLQVLFNRFKKLYPIDGLVIETQNINNAAVETNGNPSTQIAFKSSSFSDVKMTSITSIDWNINRNGVLTPTINFNPITLSNAQISRCNGINAKYVIDMGFEEGRRIGVTRSGEVIPKICYSGDEKIPFVDEYESINMYKIAYKKCVRNIYDSNPNYINIPTHCPFCGEELKWDYTSTNLICSNEKCSERLFQEVYKFFEIMGLENYGEKRIKDIYFCGSINAIINLTDINLKGWGEKSKKDFIDRLNEIKESEHPLEKIMHASNCFAGIAEKTLKIINEKKHDVDNIYDIYGIGDITTSIYNNGLIKFNKFMEDHDWIKISKPINNKLGNKFEGQSICFSGVRSKDIEEEWKKEGGIIKSGVSKGLTYLIVKDENETTAKIEKAKSYGTKIVNINNFKTIMYGNK